MLAFPQALAGVIDAARPFGQEQVPLAEAAGRVLAEAVVADVDVPPFDTTAMDGWALRSSEVRSAPGRLAAAGAIAAGTVPPPLPARSALKVMTGAPMPDGSDAVVPVEQAAESGGEVRIYDVPVPGAHVRRRGEVLARGCVLLRPGRRLTPADLVLAAGAGRESLLVARRPTAAVLVTGDEVVPPGRPLDPGKIRNTNGPLLLAALGRLGCLAEDRGLVRDDPEQLRASLSSALSRNLDLLLTTGGISAGDWDLVGGVLAELGADVRFHKVAIKPARPILFATAGRTLVFGLPGNPVSTAVAFDLFVVAAVRKGWGLEPPFPGFETARLLGPARNKGGRLAFHPATLERRDGALLATPLPSKGSHDVLNHARADGYLVLQPDSSHEAGEGVPAYPAREGMTLG